MTSPYIGTPPAPERIWAWEESRTFRWWSVGDLSGLRPDSAVEYVRDDIATIAANAALTEAVGRLTALVDEARAAFDAMYGEDDGGRDACFALLSKKVKS